MQPRSHGDSSRKKAILEASSIVTQLKFAPRCGTRPLTLPSARTRTSAFRIARRGLGPAPASVPNMRGRFPCRPAVRPACVKMAASLPRTLLSRFPNLLRSSYGVQVPLRTLCTKGPPEEGSPSSLPISPYENEPWKYLDSEEYQNRYGSRPIWADYRRNHKGGVPPQRTRKTCIRKNKVAGNPCPICRDHKLHVDFRNVKLLEQFVCAHTGMIFHAPYTGVCMRQHKKLTQAIQKARECGLLSHYVPQVEPRDADFSAVHGAVSVTPPAPTLLSGQPWYPWYSWQQPPERELSRLRRLYQGNLLEESGPPPESMPEVPSTPPAEASPEQTGSQSA